MKKVIALLILLVFALTGCTTFYTNWALTHGFIKAEDCPKVPDVPERQALPHPTIPTFATVDADGNLIKIDEVYLMNIIIQCFGTVEKFQYLVEIYEREYLNKGGKIMPDLTLEELKKLYQEKLGQLEKFNTGAMTTSAVEKQMTVEEFKHLIDAWNLLQENK
jgi:hypothetical protein